MHPVVAERKLACIEQDGSRTRFAIRLDENPDKDWACPVALEGLEAGLPDVHGTDSFQALMLARKLAYELLAARAKEGARFVDDEEGYDVDLVGLFEGGL